MTKLFQSLITAVIFSLLLLQPTYAFKLDTHVWVGQQVLDDIQDGKLTIGEFGEFTVTPEKVSALKNYPKSYLYGNIGPDGFPDLFGGQMNVHPGDGDNLGSGLWSTSEWFKHILSNKPLNKDLAFSLGYISHGAADFWAHSYVNTYSGKVFNLTDGEVESEIRHLSLEGYLNKLTPTTTRTMSGGTIKQVKGLELLNSYAFNGEALPYGFIAKELMLNDNVADQYLKSGMLHLAPIKPLKDSVIAFKEFVNTLRNSKLVLLGKVIDEIVPVVSDINEVSADATVRVCNAVSDLIGTGIVSGSGSSGGGGWLKKNIKKIANPFNDPVTNAIIDTSVAITDSSISLTKKSFDLIGSSAQCFYSVVTGNDDKKEKFYTITSEQFAIVGIDPIIPIKFKQARTVTLSSASSCDDAVLAIQDSATIVLNGVKEFVEAARIDDLIALEKSILDLQKDLVGVSIDILESTTAESIAIHNKITQRVVDSLDLACRNIETYQEIGGAVADEAAPFVINYFYAAYSGDTDGLYTEYLYQYLKLYEQGVDLASEKYLQTSFEIVNTLMDPVIDPNKSKTDKISEHINTFMFCGFPMYVGAPPALTGVACEAQGGVTRLIALKDKMSKLSAKLDITGIQAAINEKEAELQARVDELKREYEIKLLEKLNDDLDIVQLLKFVRAAQDDPTLALTSAFSTSGNGLIIVPDIIERVNKDTASNGSAFDPNNFAAAYNAVMLSKLSLLDASELNKLVSIATQNITGGVPPLFDEQDISYNILLDSIRTIDGSHQWLGESISYTQLPYQPSPSNNSYSIAIDDKGFSIYQNPITRTALFSQIFKGPLVPGVETPESGGFTSVLNSDYPYEVCATNLYPNGDQDKACSAVQ